MGWFASPFMSMGWQRSDLHFRQVTIQSKKPRPWRNHKSLILGAGSLLPVTVGAGVAGARPPFPQLMGEGSFEAVLVVLVVVVQVVASRSCHPLFFEWPKLTDQFPHKNTSRFSLQSLRFETALFLYPVIRPVAMSPWKWTTFIFLVALVYTVAVNSSNILPRVGNMRTLMHRYHWKSRLCCSHGWGLRCTVVFFRSPL